MTKQKKLKRAARARAAETGERYAAARAQVLLAKEPSPAPRARGTVTDAAVRERTGHGLDHWFRVLDRFGAATEGHRAAARHLKDDQGVSAWYAQAITVAYERARGLRVENQTSDGKFQVSISRVVPSSVSDVVDALRRKPERARWLAGADPELVRAVEEGLSRRAAIAVKDTNNARMRFAWDGSTVEIRITSKGNGRSAVVADNKGLRDRRDVERRRDMWKVPLEALRAHLSG